MDNTQRIRISEILILCSEGQETREDVLEIEGLLRNNKEAIEYYVETAMNLDYFYSLSRTQMPISSEMLPAGEIFVSSAGSHDDAMSLLYSLGEYERTAPSIEIPDKEPQCELIRNVVYSPKEKRTVSKLSMAALIVSSAAALFLIALVRLVPEKVAVAEITKTMNPVWEAGSRSLEPMDSLYIDKKTMFLKSGIVEIEFAYGATVILEGPCEFSCKSKGSVELTSGRLFAQVPPAAFGFTVETPNSRVVDLGTEFGVYVESGGSSLFQVFKGKTQVISVRPDGDVLSKMVEAGHAGEVDGRGYIYDSKFEETRYVRSIDPQSNRVWRGKAISLADIVGGGNGFGTGKANWGIDTLTGNIGVSSNSGPLMPYYTNGKYLSCPSPLIDGVFVPDGKVGPVQISSTGLVFAECPETHGTSINIIQNRYWTANDMMIPDCQLDLDGQIFEKPGECIFMHSNKGITYDLEAIRRTVPGLRINKFTSLAGVSDAVLKTLSESSRVDFWVLVDGQVKLQQVDVKPEDKAFYIDIPLTEQNRFLTIITTDSGKEYGNITMDWALFANPVLELEVE